MVGPIRLAMAGVGAGLGIDGFARGYCESGCRKDATGAYAEFWFGLVTGIIGYIGVLAVGPALWIGGAFQWREAPLPPAPQY